MPAHRRIAAIASDDRLLPGATAPGTAGRILEAALERFAEVGYAATSVRDIAAVASVKAATIYAHFASKEQILAELCRIGHEEQYHLVRDAVLASNSDPPDQIVAYVRAHVRFHCTYPMLAVISNAELHALGDELGAATFVLRGESVDLMQDIIQRGIDSGSFRVDDAWLAAAAIGGMGLRVAYWFSADHGPAAELVADTYAEYALRLLGARRVDAAPATPERAPRMQGEP